MRAKKMYKRALLQTQRVSGKMKVRFICWANSKMYEEHKVGYTQCSRATRESYNEGQYFEGNVQFNDGRGFYSAERNEIEAIDDDTAQSLIEAWQSYKVTGKVAKPVVGAYLEVPAKKAPAKTPEKIIDEMQDENIDEIMDDIFKEPKEEPKEVIGVEWDEHKKDWINVYE
jgi:hypothetical protein